MPAHARGSQGDGVITLDDLRAICRHTKVTQLDLFVEPLNAAMREFEIDANVARETHFLAQIAHESEGFIYVREIASGAEYEGRRDLGNIEPGDGERFRGRGLIQITGRDNYARCGAALGLDLLTDPGLLESPLLASRSAGWYWHEHGCNALADLGDARAITKKINGGLNGYQDRLAYLELAQQRLA